MSTNKVMKPLTLRVYDVKSGQIDYVTSKPLSIQCFLNCNFIAKKKCSNGSAAVTAVAIIDHQPHA